MWVYFIIIFSKEKILLAIIFIIFTCVLIYLIIFVFTNLFLYFCLQKCSAQSALFVHENWKKIDFVGKLKELAERRKLSDLTVGPVLTVTNET